MKTRRTLAVLSLAAFACACGSGGVQGRYVPKGETFFESLTLRSDGKVDVVMIGVRHEGSYEVDGDQVTITAPNGQKTPLKLDSSGCLTHPIAGTYCRDGSGSSASAEATADKSGPPGTEAYEARAREGQIRLEFGAAKKVRLTMSPSGASDIPERMSFDVNFEVDGNEITISLPGNERLQLTRAGNDLEGTMNGETVRFVRR
ncbi:MAG TPA: hypothetical protein VMS40_05735 [Vicinamibacterales bacterium]|nr:hypothetical protein [Vicinamibacterales bacterium]